MSGRPGLRLEVRLTDLARPPSPSEMEAMALAIQSALGTTPRLETDSPPAIGGFPGDGGVNTPGGRQAALSGSQKHSNRRKS